MIYSNWDKWKTIREMVSEKYAELKKAVFVLSRYETELEKANRIKFCKGIVKNLFPVKDMTDKQKKTWLDNISAVDLLFVYSLLNDVLRRFYYHCPMAVEIIATKNDVISKYKLHRSGELYYSNNDLYKKIERDLKRFEYISEIYDGKFNCKDVPKPRNSVIDFDNLNYRKSVIASIIEDALPRIKEHTKGKVADFETARSYFKLSSMEIVKGREPEIKCMGMLSIPNPEKEALYGEELEDIISHEVIGLDEFGHPITKGSNFQRYDYTGKPIDDDSYISPLDN